MSDPERLPASRRALMTHHFLAGGGASYVTRDLAAALPSLGWQVTVVAGSVRDAEPELDAEVFYRGLDIQPIDFTAAARAGDPMRADPPLPPVLQELPGGPPVFAELDEHAFERQVRGCARAIADAGAERADVLHLHHLTPMNEAAARVAPGVPVVGHLHGTELLLMEEIERRGPATWPHGPEWTERMRRWAAACALVLVHGERQRERAERLLDVAPGRYATIAGGIDPAAFRPLAVDRAGHWRRHLVDEPHGWIPGGGAGSARYAEGELEALSAGSAVLVHVARFAEVKRIDLLIEAFGRARPRFARRAALILVGGVVGECESEHPFDTARRLRVPDVFLAGGHPREQLPRFYSAADVLVSACDREQFGLALIEGMACGLPAIAPAALGPAEIVRDGDTGWLVEPGDVRSLAEAMIAAVNDPAEARRRGARACAAVHERFAATPIARRLASLYETITG